MNTSARTIKIAVFAAVAIAAGCGERLSDTSAKGAPSNPTSQSAMVIGVKPQESTGSQETSQTAPQDPKSNWVSKPVEQQAMPLPGQPNDHSNLAATPSQKAETAPVLESVPAAKQANSGEAKR